MTFTPVLFLLGDIVVPPPTPPPQVVSPVSPLPYLVFALVAVGMLLLMRKRRSPGSVDRG